MNFLYHHRALGEGADGNHIRQVVKAMRRLGHRVDLVSPPGVDVWHQASHNGAAGKSSLDSIKRRTPRLLIEIAEFLYNFLCLTRIKRMLESLRHVEAIYERYWIFGFAATWCAKRAGISIILEVNFTSQTTDSVYPPRSKWLDPLARRIDRWVFERADALVVVTHQLKRHLVDEFGVEKEKILVTPNAVDLGEFHPGIPSEFARSYFGVNGSRIVGFVGGFYPWHGVDLFIDAAREVVKQDKDLVFVLIGEGYMRSRMEERVREAGLDKSFRFTGHVPHRRLPRLMAGFDVCVMPDSNEHGCPMKILEYMGMAKAVIAPKLGTITDMIKDREEGLLFTPKDPSSLASSILEILGDSDLSGRLGRNARSRVEREHTWEQNVKALIQHCEEFQK